MKEDELLERVQRASQREKEALGVVVKAQAEYTKAREAHHAAYVAYEAHMASPALQESDGQA